MKVIYLLLALAQLIPLVQAETKLPEFFQRTRTSIKNPFDMRDPFKRKAQKLKSSSKKDFKQDRTTFSNLPTLDGVPLEQIRIIGVILGDDRRAIAKSISSDRNAGPESKETYVIKEGMILGHNKAEVKAILPGGIVLVEKIRNVYDQDEYIETILPVTVE